MYKLSNLAAEDFRNIYTYTLVHFGLEQADKYTHNLERIFYLLFNAPQMGRDCTDIGTDIRRYDALKHAIFYRKRVDDIFIIRILHQQMYPQLHFFDDVDTQ